MQCDLVALGAFGCSLLSKKMQFGFGDALEFIRVFRKVERKFIGAVEEIFRELLRQFRFLSIDFSHLLFTGFI